MTLIEILFSDPISFLIIAIAIIFSLSIHEYFHAWVAYFLGDPTSKDMGRLTINPLAHLDPFGTLLIFLVGFGWGKPVPINPMNFKNQKLGAVLVGIAGPFANFSLALVMSLIFRFFTFSNIFFGSFLSLFIWLNLALGIFNLIPIPPLDGSHIILALASEKVRSFLIRNSLLLIIILIFLIYRFGLGFILNPIYTLFTGASSPF
jgi:Zn-dependent protease